VKQHQGFIFFLHKLVQLRLVLVQQFPESLGLCPTCCSVRVFYQGNGKIAHNDHTQLAEKILVSVGAQRSMLFPIVQDSDYYLFYLVDSLDLIVESYALTTGSDAVLVKKQ